MKFKRTDHDDLNISLELLIEVDDYKEKFNQELKKYSSKAQLKGFRKGKTPISAIKKMYGKSVLVEVLDGLVSSNLSEYITENKLNILGNPLPNLDDNPMEFDTKELTDYAFKFDMGLAPDFDVQGLDKAFDHFEIQVDDAILTEEMDIRRKRFGDTIHPDGKVEENDIIKISAEEAELGEIIKDGWATEFSILVNRIDSEEIKEEVLKSSVGDEITFDIYDLEKDSTEKHVRKYLLNLDDNDDRVVGNGFIGKISEISRIEEAKLEQPFFDKAFGEGKVTSEIEAKEAIKTELKTHFETQEKSLTYRMIMEMLIEENKLTLPSDFLKRWLLATNKDATKEKIDRDYGDFEKNLIWSLIKTNLSKKYEVEVAPEEIREAVKKKIQGYMGQYQMAGQEMDYDSMVDRYLQNREQVEKEYEELQADKLFGKLSSEMNGITKEVSVDEFKEIVKGINEKLAEKPQEVLA